ncbi:MAG: phosphatidate cytidylyltransferase [Bacteroidaceae bacterium]
MKELLVRSISGLLFVTAIVGSFLYGPQSFVLLFGLLCAYGVWEFCTIVNDSDLVMTNRFICATSGAYLFFAFFAYCSEATGPTVFIPYLLSLLYLLVSELYFNRPNPFGNWAGAFASQLYVALPFALLNVLAFHVVDGRVCYTPIVPLSVFLFLWVSDSGAYFFGSTFSRFIPYKLFPRISPHKSWVGSIGGGLMVLLSATIVASYDPSLSLMKWFGLGLVVCVFGTWGDLVESMLKRQFKIKDSGKFLPGHGGLLDRFDSSLLAIPASILYLYTVTQVF